MIELQSIELQSIVMFYDVRLDVHLGHLFLVPFYVSLFKNVHVYRNIKCKLMYLNVVYCCYIFVLLSFFFLVSSRQFSFNFDVFQLRFTVHVSIL